eukprot:15459912-Alexandrium_andersonii.AAC.1
MGCEAELVHPGHRKCNSTPRPLAAGKRCVRRHHCPGGDQGDRLNHPIANYDESVLSGGIRSTVPVVAVRTV